MANDSSTKNPSPSETTKTPFPVAGQSGPASATTPSATSDASDGSDAPGSAAPAVDQLIKRVAQSAHAAIDGAAGKASSLAEGLQGRVDAVGDTRDEWLDAAREAVRQHPFAAIGGAIVVGLALHSLMSSNRR